MQEKFLIQGLLKENIEIPPPTRNAAYYQELAEKQKTKRKTKYEKNKTEILKSRKETYTAGPDKILRSKILYNLNHGLTLKPHFASIVKYNLYYDPTESRWKTR